MKSHKPTHQHCLAASMLSFLIPGSNLAFADTGAGLHSGEWKGAIINHEDKRYTTRYNVNYENESNKESLNIEIIYVDNKNSYQLTDIKVKDNTLQFRIPRESDVKTCTLELSGENSYEGQCTSNEAKHGETSQIFMSLSE